MQAYLPAATAELIDLYGRRRRLYRQFKNLLCFAKTPTKGLKQ
jgi:hypothetical protein